MICAAFSTYRLHHYHPECFKYKENLTLKKTVLYITLTVLIAAMLLPAAALADMNVSLILSNDAPEFSAPGDEFSIILHIKGSYEVHAANLSVDYDPASLEVKSAEQCEFLKNEAEEKGPLVVLDEKTLAAKGQIKLGLVFPMEGMQGEGDMIKVRFKIKEGVKEHQQVILTVYEFGYMPADQTSATPIHVTTQNTTVHIANGSDPSYGYIPGEEVLPEAGPQMTDRPHPAIDAVSTAKPQNTEAPSSEKPSEDPGTVTENPDAPENTEAPAASASPAPSKPDSDKDKKKNTTRTIVYICAGVIAAAAIVVLVLTRKKKHGR